MLQDGASSSQPDAQFLGDLFAQEEDLVGHCDGERSTEHLNPEF